MRIWIFTIILSAVFMFAVVPQAHATDWWSKAKEILNSDSGNAISKSIQTPHSDAGYLTDSEVSAGLREALKIGNTKGCRAYWC